MQFFYLMSRILHITVIILLVFYSCSNYKEGDTEKWKQEVFETEHSFAAMAQKDGVPAAFLNYADDEAVLVRNNKLIIGKDALRDYYDAQSSGDNNVSLTWTPEFIDIAESGELANTYGYYTFSYIDSTNNKVENKGVFHTIWKRQPDGSWKFVWD